MCNRIELIPIQKLAADIKKAAIEFTETEARFLVDAYYQRQDERIRAESQVRSMENEPHAILDWLGVQSFALENQLKGVLDVYSSNHPIGRRIRTVVGVGPVIAAGMLAHIDITKADTAGAIWRFAGQDPTLEWKKGQKRPFNAHLKTLCWKLGESFVKVSSHKDDFYGKIYKERKEVEIIKNENMEFKEQAKEKLEKYNIGKTTDAYKAYSSGKLPPAHIHARAKRYAVKIFLSHLHEVWYEHHYGKPAPVPYVFAHAGHTHKIECPF
tara:strand:+ start:2787 stop:3593 length:807 start_codon:yes stop_codon:yes gene_type:complete